MYKEFKKNLGMRFIINVPCSQNDIMLLLQLRPSEQNLRESSSHYDTALSQLALTDKPWYHGVLSQQEAEKRMREMDVNSFLVRESVQDEGINLILSVKNGDKCYHFPIIGKYEIQGTHDHLPFPSLQELVNYYMQSGLPAESSGGELIQLTLPCTSGISEPASSEMEHIYSSIHFPNDDKNKRLPVLCRTEE